MALKLLSGQHLPACSGFCSACAGSLSGVRLFATLWTVACQVPLSMDFSGKNTGVGCHFFLQGIFPLQGSNLHFLHLPYCRCTLVAEPSGKLHMLRENSLFLSGKSSWHLAAFSLLESCTWAAWLWLGQGSIRTSRIARESDPQGEGLIEAP